jgi:hypothetical protein
MTTMTAKTFTVPVLCGWCGADMGEKDGFTENIPTHGICARCSSAMLKEAGYES